MLAESLPDSSAPISGAELLFHELAGYLKPEDIAQLRSAYLFSQSAHSGQYRESGEPYISHPLAVTSILGKMHLDTQTLTAALLHDVMEDNERILDIYSSKAYGFDAYFKHQFGDYVYDNAMALKTKPFENFSGSNDEMKKQQRFFEYCS